MPVADRAWAHVNGKFVGALTFVDKPAGWASKDDQLRYLWDLLSRDNVTDTEVFCQLQRANEALVKTNMQRLTKQSIVSSNLATSKNSVDVAALSKVRKAVAAQEQLYEGSVPLHTAVVILVHRDSLDDLDEGCRYLQSCVRRPAWIDRELEYAWLIWQQTLPVCWDSMLIRPFNRRLCYLTGEAPGFMSLVLPQAADEDGFELISDEGGVPLYIDLFNQHRHLAVFGTTRSGKSVMISGWLTQALSRKIPIVVWTSRQTEPAPSRITQPSWVLRLVPISTLGQRETTFLKFPTCDRFRWSKHRTGCRIILLSWNQRS
jgi:hypothetical protein